jgi:hypothetical protein
LVDTEEKVSGVRFQVSGERSIGHRVFQLAASNWQQAATIDWR